MIKHRTLTSSLKHSNNNALKCVLKPLSIAILTSCMFLSCGEAYSYNRINNTNLKGADIGTSSAKETFSNNQVNDHGGAIKETTATNKIGNIYADFNNNSIVTTGNKYGGAIYNSATIGNIIGDVAQNYIKTSGIGYGGVIYSTKILGELKGNYTGNYVESSGGHVYGGAIMVNSTSALINGISGNFEDNYVKITEKDTSKYAYGGAIYNTGEIGGFDVAQDKVLVYLETKTTYINPETGETFIYYSRPNDTILDEYKNKLESGEYKTYYYHKETTTTAKSATDYATNIQSYQDKISAGTLFTTQGFVPEESQMTKFVSGINGDFNRNKAIATANVSYGGAIFNNGGHIGDIVGNFDQNSSESTSSTAYSGALHNSGIITAIKGNFSKNSASSQRGAAYGGAIYNSGTITQIEGNFEENSAKANGGATKYAYGGAIGNTGTTSVKGNFSKNKAETVATGNSYARGGAIYNTGKITISGELSENSAYSKNSVAYGGAIYNTGELNILNSSFQKNFVKSDTSTSVYGGAIYSSANVNIVADNYNSLFKDNYVQTADNDPNYQAVYMGAGATLTLDTKNNGTITFKDKIFGNGSGYNLALKSTDNTGSISLLNTIENSIVTTDTANINFINNELLTYKIKTWNSDNNSLYNFDIDLSSQLGDCIQTTVAGSSGFVTINSLNFVQDSDENLITIQLLDLYDTVNDSLQLKFGDNIKFLGTDKTFDPKTEKISNLLPNTVYNDETFVINDGLYLNSNKTTNDSISIVQGGLIRGLEELVRKETTDEKNFIFRTDTPYYTSENLGLLEGTLNIEGNNIGTLDLNGHKGITVTKDATLNISNVAIHNELTGDHISLITNEGTLVVDGVKFNDSNLTEANTAYIGGIIKNLNTVSSIANSQFNNNNITSESTVPSFWGGIISNGRNGNENTLISEIVNTEFKNNKIFSEKAAPHGAGILNFAKDGYSATIGRIDSVIFEGNEMTSTPDQFGGANGVAIDNNENGVIGIITNSIFKNNKTYRTGEATTTSNYHASATLDNYNYIGEISNCIFEGNSAESVASEATSGAIMNLFTDNEHIQGYIGKIENVDFINNRVFSVNDIAESGALTSGKTSDNDGTSYIGAITANFIGNSAESTNYYAYGGAMVNGGVVESIKGQFLNNSAKSGRDDSDYIGAFGGAIANTSNYGEIGNIDANFINNSVSSTKASSASGGAIYNRGESTIADINGVFYNNYANAIKSNAIGGAIVNFTATIKDINGNFVNNYAKGQTYACGGAIYNYSSATIDDITGDFVNNYAEATETYTYGGAIANLNASIKNINGNFVNNHTSTTGTWAQGGAILNNNSTINNIKGSFVKNYAAAIDTTVQDAGNAAGGGAIMNRTNATINSIVADFAENYVKSNLGDASGGAIENRAVIIELSNSTFKNNYVETTATDKNAIGGAIYNRYDGSITNGIKNSSFINNYAKAPNGTAKGGAIYIDNDLKILADNGSSIFKDNYVEDKNGKRQEAIYVTSNANLTLEAKNNGKIIFNDQINGDEGYRITTSGDKSGRLYINNDIISANIIHDSITTNVFDPYYLNNSNSLTMNSGTLNLNSLDFKSLKFKDFALNGGTINLTSTPVNLATKSIGRIIADNYSNATGGSVVVQGLKVSNEDSKNLVTNLLFADKSFANNVTYKGSDLYYTPIYKYSVKYRNDLGDNNGYFQFARGNGSSYNDFNPAVLPSSVNSQVGAYAAMNETFNYAFRHADYSFMPLPKRIRTSMANKYAISEGESMPYTTEYSREAGIWYQPYANFEKVGLSNGPETEVQSYGSLVGGDSEYKELRHGWGTVTTPYIGYNGSSQHYNGVSTYTNGGILGVTQTFYKNDFFTALTVNAGASVGEANTMYGNENFTTLMAGIASKTGYNFEFNQGKFIIQPSWMMAYSFINTFDYTNATGVRIDSDPLHSIQFHPNLKFMGNVGKGWQPYASVGMVWNVLNDTKVMADDARLPEMSIKPYIEYGVGIQKTWKDRFTGFLQAMLRNGGRNGVALSFGFRWTIGRDHYSEKVQRVENNFNEKTVSKIEKANKEISKKVEENISTNENKGFFNKIKNKISSVLHHEVIEEDNSPTVLKQLSNVEKRRLSNR